ncbi:hypothetical protein PEC311524_32450 [Pectobacterium carotovorum subsp. carotovorum]|nr:hypothetical protein PEC311524_32450 [Pectobacterium carotovorum subsp. carotovorum]
MKNQGECGQKITTLQGGNVKCITVETFCNIDGWIIWIL